MSNRRIRGSLQGNPRGAQRMMPGGLDLNFPPPEQNMGLIGTSVDSSAPEIMQPREHGRSQLQSMDNVQVIDDEISIVSPTEFSEARKNRLRYRQIMTNETSGVYHGYGPVMIEDDEVPNSYSQRQLLGDMHVYRGYGNSELVPVPMSTVPYSSNIHMNMQVNETTEEKDAIMSSEEPESESSSQVVTINCPICISAISDATTTRCGHIFCRLCIEAAIKSQHKCPTCRRKLKKNDIFRIYLPASN